MLVVRSSFILVLFSIYIFFFACEKGGDGSREIWMHYCKDISCFCESTRPEVGHQKFRSRKTSSSTVISFYWICMWVAVDTNKHVNASSLSFLFRWSILAFLDKRLLNIILCWFDGVDRQRTIYLLFFVSFLLVLFCEFTLTGMVDNDTENRKY